MEIYWESERWFPDIRVCLHLYIGDSLDFFHIIGEIRSQDLSVL